jgi:putative transcriptional regulator
VGRRRRDRGPALSVKGGWGTGKKRVRAGEEQLKNHLKTLRAERGWSQIELAERLQVSRQTVNAIENERYDPSLPLAFEIARTFGLPIEEIFEAP